MMKTMTENDKEDKDENKTRMMMTENDYKDDKDEDGK